MARPPASGAAPSSSHALEAEDDFDPFTNSNSNEGADDEQQGEEGSANAESDKDGLYAILNLEKDCTPEEVGRSYRRLAGKLLAGKGVVHVELRWMLSSSFSAALLHPDRHPSPSLKAAADSRFQSISRAFEVLSDERKRMIYDMLGEEGLGTSWELGSKYKTGEELRKEFERLGRKQVEVSVENLIKSKGELTTTLDARVLLLSAERRRELGGPAHMTIGERMQSVQVKQLFLKHSFSNPISPTTSLLITSQLLSRGGTGGGNLLVKLLHRPSSKVNMEIGTTMLRPRAFSFKTTYAPDNETFVTFDTSARTTAHPPPFSIVFGRSVAESLTATFAVRSGIYSLFSWGTSSLEPISTSTLSFSLIHNSGWSTALTTGLNGSQLNLDYSLPTMLSCKVRVGSAITSTGQLSSTISADRKITENTRAGMSIDLASNGIITLKVRLSRLGQKISFPVIVASDWDPVVIGVLLIGPVCGVLGVEKLFVEPRKKRKVSNRISELRKENAEFIEEKRKEASDAVELLREHVKRKIEAERSSNGLIIEEAIYGVLDSPTTAKDSRSLDVSIPLQSLTASSQLVIPSGRSKSHLLGFFDCAMGEKKKLRIRYTFKGRAHECEVGDLVGVGLPQRAHLIEE